MGETEVLKANVWGLTVYSLDAPTCSDQANVAFNSKVEFSSSTNHTEAEQCVNGIVDQPEGSQLETCATDHQYEPWIRVDLGQEYPVNSVQVWGAANCSCRLGAFRMSLLKDRSTSSVIAEKDFVVHCSGASLDDECSGNASQNMFEWSVPRDAMGRYVLIQQEFRTSNLELSEIKVWSCGSDDSDVKPLISTNHKRLQVSEAFDIDSSYLHDK